LVLAMEFLWLRAWAGRACGEGRLAETAQDSVVVVSLGPHDCGRRILACRWDPRDSGGRHAPFAASYFASARRGPRARGGGLRLRDSHCRDGVGLRRHVDAALFD